MVCSSATERNSLLTTGNMPPRLAKDTVCFYLLYCMYNSMSECTKICVLKSDTDFNKTLGVSRHRCLWQLEKGGELMYRFFSVSFYSDLFILVTGWRVLDTGFVFDESEWSFGSCFRVWGPVSLNKLPIYQYPSVTSSNRRWRLLRKVRCFEIIVNVSRKT